jgi:membrane-bound lytic murein transglycosylase B
MVYPATVARTARGNACNQGLVASTAGRNWAAGISTATTPPEITKYGLVDLQNGAEPTEYWLANANFFAITQYNRSYFYAMSVVELGRPSNSCANECKRNGSWNMDLPTVLYS